jgi:autotransporter passenger strand-loop-strand repeat protein
MSNPIPPFISGGSLFNVSPGQVYTGVIEGSLIVLSGGEVLDSLVSAGGVEVLHDSDSVDSGLTIGSGGAEFVDSGGIETGAIISSGGSGILEGGTALGTQVDGGLLSAQGGSTVSNTVIDGGRLVALSAVDTIVGNQGVFQVASAVSATIESGGTIELIDNFGSDGVTALATQAGATVEVGPGFTLSQFVVGSAVQLDVLGGGTASATTVSAGGRESVSGSAIVTSVLSAVQEVFFGGYAQATTIGSGGEQIVDSHALASATTVGSGATEIVNSGGAAAGATISGGTLEIASGGSLTGTVQFAGSGGTLQIDGTAMPASTISGFAPDDTIDLAGVSFASGGAVGLQGGNFLAINAGGRGYTLDLDPSASFAGLSFRLSSDGNGGTEVQVLPQLSINISYDASVANAPAGFESAVSSGVAFFESTFTNPVTLNIDVGYGALGDTSGTLVGDNLGISVPTFGSAGSPQPAIYGPDVAYS